jgi:hypothetical protein
MTLDLCSLDKKLGIDNTQLELRHEFEVGIERIIKRDFDPARIEAVLHQAIQSLDAAKRSKDQLSQRNAIKKFVGIFSGGNNRHRDITTQHLLEAQRATYVLIDRLAENDMILADAIMVNQQAIKRLQLNQVVHSEMFIESLWNTNQRFDKIERRLLDHTYKINLLEFHAELISYVHQQRIESNFLTEKDSIARIIEISTEYFQIVGSSLSQYAKEDPKNQYRWSRNVMLYCRTLLTEFSSLGKTGEAGAYKWEEFTVFQLISNLYSSFDVLLSGKYLEHLKMQYPLAYFEGATISARILYLAFKGFQGGMHARELSETILKELDLPQDYSTNSLSFGTELLSQMKLNASESYLFNGLNSIVKEIEIENLDPIYNNQNNFFIDEEKSHLDDFKVSEVSLGRYYEVLQGNCTINFHIQYATNNSAEFESIRLVYELINFDRFFGIDELKSIAEKNKLNSEFLVRNGQIVCELTNERKPDWLSWKEQKSEIVRFIEDLTNDLNQRK